MPEKNIPSELVVSLDELDECMNIRSSAQEEAIVEDLRRVLNEFLQSQEERAYTAFICRYYYADCIDHIAEMLGVSKSTVLRELARLRNELREQLKAEGYDYE